MFTTLRSNSISNGAYSVQKTSAPFDKKGQRKLAWLACVNCRVSKVKCSGEQSGCQRCSEKAIDCCYPNDRRGSKPSKRNTSSSKTGSESNELIAQDGALDSSAGVPASKSRSTFGSQFEPIQNASSHHIPAIATGELASQSTADEHCYSTLLSDLWNCPQHEDNRDAGSWRSLATPDTPLASPIFDSFPNPDGQVGSDPIHSAQPTHVRTPLSIDGICFCSSDVVGLYEHIQMTLVWKVRDEASTADTLLQDQKRALSDCRSLLKCDSCRSQSKHITLLTAMCEKVLSSMEILYETRASCFRRNSRLDARAMIGVAGDSMNIDFAQRRSKESFRAGITYGPQQRQPQDDRHFDESLTRDVSRGSIEDQSNTDANHKVTIGEWQLDDDDEVLVFRGLVSARVTQLSGLVATLEGIANEHQWPHLHSDLCDMRERCDSLSHRIGV